MNAVKKAPDDVVYARGTFRLGFMVRLQILLDGRVSYETKSPVDVQHDPPGVLARQGEGEAVLMTGWPWERWLARRRAGKPMAAPQENAPRSLTEAKQAVFKRAAEMTPRPIGTDLIPSPASDDFESGACGHGFDPES